MGNACSKRPATIEFTDKPFDPLLLFKSLQQDLQSARYTNVLSLGEVVVDGCTVRCLATSSLCTQRGKYASCFSICDLP